MLKVFKIVKLFELIQAKPRQLNCTEGKILVNWLKLLKWSN